ncbi:MAG: TlpA family protein disulfide reductase [Bacteroidales bacterium]
MKRIIYLSLVLLVLCVLSSYGQKQNLVATIDGWGNDTIIVVKMSTSIPEEKLDTLVAVNNKVVYNTERDTLMLMLFNKSSFAVSACAVEATIMTNSEVLIEGKVFDKKIEYVASGNDLMRDFVQVRKDYLIFDMAIDSVNTLINKSYQDPGSEKLFDERGRLLDKKRDVKLNYIRNNRNTDLAALYTFQMPIKRFMETYSLLGDQAKNGVYKSMLESKLKRTKDFEQVQLLKEKATISKGNPAPDFTLVSINGEKFSLSDFKGKWVVLDFWGSWCAPCLNGMPQMKSMYDKYKGKLEIIGVACKDNDDKWRKAVKNNELNWTQLFGDDSVHIDYAIEAYPTKIVIDPTGTIVYKAVGETTGFYEEVDKVMKCDKMLTIK